MILRSLVLVFVLVGTAWGQVPMDSAIQADAAGVSDPWGSLALADRLAPVEARQDEAVAVLLGAVQDPRTEAEARVRLRTLLLRSPPRSAWAAAYRAAANGSDEALALHADRAALQIRRTRGAALERLKARHRADLEDLDLRRAVMEGLLLSGRPNQAMSIYDEIEGHESLIDLQIVALLARGRVDEAQALDSRRVPSLCEEGPSRCGPWLAEEGWSVAASQGLRDLLKSRGEWGRSRMDRGRMAAALAAVEETRGRDSSVIGAWKRAVELDPKNVQYREAYVQALLETGQIGTARGAARAEDRGLYNSIQAVKKVSRIDPSDERLATTQALEAALSLSPSQPIVIRAWVHHRLKTGHPDSALSALEPLLGGRPDPALTDLAVWAASAAGRPEVGMRVVLAELRVTHDARRWQALVDQLAALLPQVAEAAKRDSEPRRALSLYTLARSLAPDSTSILLGLGGTWWALGDLDQTLRAFESARAQGPGNRQALFSLVAVLKSMEREDEAMEILRDSGYADYHTQLLELELQIALAARPARDALRGDRTEEAIELYLSLLREHPNNPGLMHGLADAYITGRRYQEAADAYALAQRVQPKNPWLRLGEANSLVALGEPALAKGVLERMGDPGDPKLLEAMFRTSLAIARMEADLLARSGHVVEAYEKYSVLLEVDPGWETLGGLARLYMSRWQYPVAQAFFEEALDLDPGNSELEMGVIEVLIARDRLEDAQHRVGALVASDPAPAHLHLAATVERRLQIQRAIDAALLGRLDESNRVLEALVETWPEEPDVRTALSDLRMRQERPEEAWEHAMTIIVSDPVHAGGLAAAQRAGLVLDRHAELLSLYQAAYIHEPSAWISEEIDAMELAMELEKARELAASEGAAAAGSAIEKAAARYGIQDGRPWVQIGGAWMSIDQPQGALQAFELAHSLDPGDPGAVKGMSGAWWVMGRFSPAEEVLATHWSRYGDLAIGAELARVQVRRGHRVEAQDTLAALMQAHASGADRPVPRPPDPLPVASLPSGRVPQVAPDEPPPAPLGPPRFPEVDLGAVRSEVFNPYRLTTYAGAGVAIRPGDPGLQQLQMTMAPLAMEVVLRGPYRLNLEFVGASLDDGQRQILSVSPSVALATSERGIFHSSIRAGLQGTATALPRLTWAGMVRGRFDPGLAFEIESVRAPVSGSLFAWAGDDSGDSGRVQDTWVGGRMSLSGDSERSVGVLGRAGHTDGAALDAVPWSQAMGWVHLPLLGETPRLWLPQIGLSLEGMVLNHDRQVGGFGLDQAGMFSPQAYRSASGRLLGRWTTPRERFGLCTVLGAGPQQVLGEPTLYLGPGQYLGYQAEVELRLEMIEGWVLAGGFKHQATRGEWYQNIGVVQLQRGRADSGLAAPSAAFASAVHGPPVIGAEACGPGWSEWGQ